MARLVSLFVLDASEMKQAASRDVAARHASPPSKRPPKHAILGNPGPQNRPSLILAINSSSGPTSHQHLNKRVLEQRVSSSVYVFTKAIHQLSQTCFRPLSKTRRRICISGNLRELMREYIYIYIYTCLLYIYIYICHTCPEVHPFLF